MAHEVNYTPDPSGNNPPGNCGMSFFSSGSGAPTCAGIEGRLYVNEDTGDFYEYRSGAWVLLFSSGGGGGGAGLTYYQGAFTDPNGNVTGSVGDLYYSRIAIGGDGTLWAKTTGTATNTGWGN